MLELDLQEEPDIEDDDDDELKCVNCGSTDVHWMNIRGKWILHNDKDDNIHFC